MYRHLRDAWIDNRDSLQTVKIYSIILIMRYNEELWIGVQQSNVSVWSRRKHEIALNESSMWYSHITLYSTVHRKRRPQVGREKKEEKKWEVSWGNDWMSHDGVEVKERCVRGDEGEDQREARSRAERRDWARASPSSEKSRATVAHFADS